MKTCTKCGATDHEFFKDKCSSDGYRSHCKQCMAEYFHANRDRINATAKGRYGIARDRINAAVRARNSMNREKVNAAQRASRARNIEKARAYDRTRKRVTTSESNALANAKRKQWRKEHPIQAKAFDKQIDAKRRSTPRGRLNDNTRRAISMSLKGEKAGRHWETLVGYTVDRLKQHLEKQFSPGMTWDNYGPVWHIDHKIPKSAFNFETPEDADFKRCWALKNLQPMWASANMSKNDRLTKPFQPSLLIP